MTNKQGRRIALTMPDDLDATITALAQIQNVPKTQIIMGFLREIHEPMQLLLAALQQVEAAKQTPVQALAPIFQMVTEQYSDVALDFAKLAQETKRD